MDSYTALIKQYIMTGNQNINDWSTMLVTIGIIVLVELLVSYQGLWRLKYQIVGTLLVLGIPPSKGDWQWPRAEEQSEKRHVPQALNIMMPLWLELYVR